MSTLISTLQICLYSYFSQLLRDVHSTDVVVAAGGLKAKRPPPQWEIKRHIRSRFSVLVARTDNGDSLNPDFAHHRRFMANATAHQRF